MKCPYCIKVCSKCKKILIAYKGNFYKHKGGKYGLKADCKQCKKKYRKQYYEDNKEHNKKYYQDNKEYLSEYYKQWYENNKEHRAEYNKKYYQDNKKYFSEYNTQWYKDNKDHCKEYKKQYYQNNKEYLSEYKKQYYQNNPHKTFNACAKRRQLEEKQGRGITKAQWLEMMEFFNWECAYSGIQLNKDNRTIDHIIPLVKGGEHEIWNCVPCYANYNYTKHVNDILEWYAQQDFFNEARLNKIYEWIEYAHKKWGD